jgi:hypothetical protein
MSDFQDLPSMAALLRKPKPKPKLDSYRYPTIRVKREVLKRIKKTKTILANHGVPISNLSSTAILNLALDALHERFLREGIEIVEID